MKLTRLITILLPLATLAGPAIQNAPAASLAKKIGRPLPQATVSRLHALQQGDAIQLRWEVVPNCDGYRLYHQDGDEVQAGASWIPVDGALTSLHQYDNVVPGGHYSFRVAPRYGSEEGESSPAVTVIMKDKKTSVRSDLGK